MVVAGLNGLGRFCQRARTGFVPSVSSTLTGLVTRRMIVVLESVAFGFLPAAVKVTKKSPWSLAVGCHVSVPTDLSGAAVKTALLPAGSAERFATSEETAAQFVDAV